MQHQAQTTAEWNATSRHQQSPHHENPKLRSAANAVTHNLPSFLRSSQNVAIRHLQSCEQDHRRWCYMLLRTRQQRHQHHGYATIATMQAPNKTRNSIHITLGSQTGRKQRTKNAKTWRWRRALTRRRQEIHPQTHTDKSIASSQIPMKSEKLTFSSETSPFFLYVFLF